VGATAFTVVVAACAGPRHVAQDDQLVYRSQGAGRFEFIARVTSEEPEWSPRAESDRRTRIQWYIQDHKLCPTGYIIERRAAVSVYPQLGESDIFYGGRCK